MHNVVSTLLLLSNVPCAPMHLHTIIEAFELYAGDKVHGPSPVYPGSCSIFAFQNKFWFVKLFNTLHSTFLPAFVSPIANCSHCFSVLLTQWGAFHHVIWGCLRPGDPGSVLSMCPISTAISPNSLSLTVILLTIDNAVPKCLTLLLWEMLLSDNKLFSTQSGYPLRPLAFF